MDKSKLKVSYLDIDKSSRELASLVKTEFKPDLILAVGGGGFIPARIMRTILNIPMYAIAVSSYTNNKTQLPEITISQWIDPVILKDKRVLIVDEVDDTRKTINFIVNRLINELGQPQLLGLAIIHNKTKDKDSSINLSELGVYYRVANTISDVWVHYPWD